jgi:hypothetical protein
MRKIALLLLLLLALAIVLPCLVYSQGVMQMDVSVIRRAASGSFEPPTCSVQTVFMLYTKDKFYIETDLDTLILDKLPQPAHFTEKNQVLHADQLHNGQMYGVQFVEAAEGLTWYVAPVVRNPSRPGALYSIIISSNKNCNQQQAYVTTKQ